MITLKDIEYLVYMAREKGFSESCPVYIKKEASSYGDSVDIIIASKGRTFTLHMPPEMKSLELDYYISTNEFISGGGQ
jgi:hypothetical protein